MCHADYKVDIDHVCAAEDRCYSWNAQLSAARATVMSWNSVTGRALILVERRKQTKRKVGLRGLACQAAAVPAKHALPPTAPPPAHLQFDPAGRCRSEWTSQIVRGAPPRYRARSRSGPRGYY